MTALAREVLPWTWVCFGVAVASGTLLFSSKALKYYANIPFRLKIALLMLAGLNMVLFHMLTRPGVRQWDLARPPLAARLAGGLSLLLWIGIVAAGRWIGFTMK